jgi:membrane-associated protease RseP (regulator of RpoE activity)
MLDFAFFISVLLLVVIYSLLGHISFDLAAFLIFILIVAFLVYRDRKKVRLDGIVLIRRTKKGRNFIDKIAKRNPRFWRKMSIAGIAVAIPAIIIVSAFLFTNSLSIIQGKAEGGVKFLLPGPVSAPVTVPGVFIVPWWIWVIGVMSVMIPHELSHGIICRLEKIRIKAVGWLLLIIIPGAFVEPDEKQLKKAKRSTKLKVYAAGSFANIMLALSILVLFSLLSVLLFYPAGMHFQTIENSSANMTGLSGSIIRIDDISVSSVEELSAILSEHSPGDKITVETAKNNLVMPTLQLTGSLESLAPRLMVVTDFNETESKVVTLGEREGKAFLGVTNFIPTYSTFVDIGVYYAILIIFIWIYIFNLGIGIINLLPIKPLDGGLFFEEIVAKKKRGRMMVKIVSGILLFLLLFNILGPIFF